MLSYNEILQGSLSLSLGLSLNIQQVELIGMEYRGKKYAMARALHIELARTRYHVQERRRTFADDQRLLNVETQPQCSFFVSLERG